MVAWWEAMSLVEQIFAVVGIASTVLLVVQVILLIIGFGSDTDAGGIDADADAGGGFDADADFGDAPGGISEEISIDMPDVDIDIDVHAGDWYGPSDSAPDGGFVVETNTEVPSGSGLHIFTMQGIITFFAVFGWSGLVMLKAGLPAPASVGLAIVFGAVAMYLVALLFRAMLRLQQDGSMDIRNALGKSGTVYMNIPAKRERYGKVHIVIQEQLMELEAVTDEEESIKTGAEVTVVGISNGNSLIVRKK
ncbi:NfeD family protein [Christensenellaceae bacterium OttesenSCG-928-K19]|nr:NfeD family protein [Christensenellaceae bacterium OttesenSCG-928-K19]